jgi:hypothetical protein
MRSMVEGVCHRDFAQPYSPSTALRAVPLPVPGRICATSGT